MNVILDLPSVHCTRQYLTESKILASGTLGSMTRGPATMDASSLIALIKYTMSSTTSKLDVAPMVRLGCVILSISEQCYKTEIIQHRIIRGWQEQQYLGCEISNLRDIYPNTYITAITLDSFISYTFDKCSSIIYRQDGQERVHTFLPGDMDTDWVAIPITQRQLRSSFVVPYIAAFMTSSLWSGKVNHVMRGMYQDSGKTRSINSVFRLMPAANSVHIEGPKRVMLVLVESFNISTQRTVMIDGVPVNVFDNTRDIEEEDFTDIWTQWFRNEDLNYLKKQAVLAINDMTAYNCVENTSSIALSVVAELYATLYMGMGVETKADTPKYDWEAPARGAWSVFNNDTVGTNCPLKTDFWDPAPDRDPAPGRRRMADITSVPCQHGTSHQQDSS